MNTSPIVRYAAAAGAGAVVVGLGVALGSGLGSSQSPSIALAGTSVAANGSGAVAGITVNGTGTVKGTPDTLRLDMAVEVTEPSVDAALTRANAAASSVHDALKQAGVTDKDLQTTGLSINPVYDYPDGGKGVLRGYSVAESVTATLRDIDKAGATISAAVTAGGDDARVNWVGLDLKANGPMLIEARKQAVADARAKAEAYAQVSGKDLGDLVAISETVSTPSPMTNADVFASGSTSSVPIQVGSQAVAVTVSAVYAFG